MFVGCFLSLFLLLVWSKFIDGNLPKDSQSFFFFFSKDDKNVHLYKYQWACDCFLFGVSSLASAVRVAVGVGVGYGRFVVQPVPVCGRLSVSRGRLRLLLGGISVRC